MEKQKLRRSEVNVLHTWDLSRIFKTESEYEKSIEEIRKTVGLFVEEFKDNLNTAKQINEALTIYRPLQEKMMYAGAYASLNMSSDATDEKNVLRQANFGIFMQEMSNSLSFFMAELKEKDEALLKQASETNKENEGFLKLLIRQKQHSLPRIVDEAFTKLGGFLSVPYQNYSRFKLADMKFPDFVVNGKSYPLSFTLFENDWSYEKDHDVRRKAHEAFYQVLGDYQHGLANNYQAEVIKQKAMADLTGFDSVIDYLLFNQDVTRDMYDRQIDVIMEHLAKPMRKYAKLIQTIHGLDKMTYADLKLAVDVDYEPPVTISETRQYMIDGLAALGPEYAKMVERAFDERWIDFPQNIGKSTGGFCSSPYKLGSFILINWNGRMNEAFVLAHEIGHAGHFYFSHQNQNSFNSRPSMYFIEAPSTMNELIVANHFLKQNEDLRFKRWVLSTMVSRTYFHNFVTHLLEAAFQREVYLRVDGRKPLSANILNKIKNDVIKRFWGDEVEIPGYAGLTWIRQPHYFMGLYPYTYSAGLTVSTAAAKKIFNGELAIERWLDVLRAGSTKDPLGLAKMVDVDLSTDKPLMETIAYIESMIDEMIEITDKLNK